MSLIHPLPMSIISIYSGYRTVRQKGKKLLPHLNVFQLKNRAPLGRKWITICDCRGTVEVWEGGHPWNVLIAQSHVWFLSGLREMMLRSLRQVLLILFLLGEHSHLRYGMCSFPSDWLHFPLFSCMPGKAQFEVRAAGRCRLTLLTSR